MPVRNTIRQDASESYYHIYARGAGKQSIFPEPADYQFFLNLFARYLSKKPETGSYGLYPHYAGAIELLCYCLIGNHFHLLLYQQEQGNIAKFMQSFLTSYTRYFNKKYKSSGPLLESRYKAALIDADGYLTHISRYIHLNPRYWQRYPYSSLGFYYKSSAPDWLSPQKVTDLFHDQTEYLTFLKDYQAHKDMLEEIKYDLAL